MLNLQPSKNDQPHHCQPMIKGFNTQVRSSLLASDEGNGRCHEVMTLGLDFGGGCPRALIKERLVASGHQSPESLRHQFVLPTVPLLCKVLEEDRDRDANGVAKEFAHRVSHRLKVATAPNEAVLYQAVMLGLCNSERFDPTRPVIWTEQSLTRAVTLYNPAGFYQ